MQILSLQKQLGGGVGGWSLVFWGFVGVGFFLCVCVCCFEFTGKNIILYSLEYMSTQHRNIS